MNYSLNLDFQTINHFFIKTKMSSEVVDNLCHDLEKLEGSVERAPVLGGNVYSSVRSSNYKKVPLSFWGSLLLRQAVLEANDRHFKYDLTSWAESLSYLTYGEGDHYKKWHPDIAPSAFNEGEIRKLTVLMGLSDPDDYGGGEFCFYEGRVREYCKLLKGEICVFPSPLMHRVLPVKSGIRKTLIGWYGGPPFK